MKDLFEGLEPAPLGKIIGFIVVSMTVFAILSLFMDSDGERQLSAFTWLFLVLEFVFMFINYLIVRTKKAFANYKAK